MFFLICSLPLRLHFEDWGSVSVLHPVEKAALFGLWQQRDKKKDDDFVSLFDITTESLLARDRSPRCQNNLRHRLAHYIN